MLTFFLMFPLALISAVVLGSFYWSILRALEARFAKQSCDNQTFVPVSIIRTNSYFGAPSNATLCFSIAVLAVGVISPQVNSVKMNSNTEAAIAVVKHVVS